MAEDRIRLDGDVEEAVERIAKRMAKRMTRGEECPYCHSRVPSVALHILDCPALELERDGEKLG